MAVSNAIGSNVFDINLGLGLPFLIRTIIDRGRPFPLLDDELQVNLSLSFTIFLTIRCMYVYTF